MFPVTKQLLVHVSLDVQKHGQTTTSVGAFYKLVTTHHTHLIGWYKGLIYTCTCTAVDWQMF